MGNLPVIISPNKDLLVWTHCIAPSMAEAVAMTKYSPNVTVSMSCLMDKSPSWWREMPASSMEARTGSMKFTSWPMNNKQSQQEVDRGFHYQMLPQWHTSSRKATPYKTPQTVPQTGDNAFKHLSYKWEPNFMQHSNWHPDFSSYRENIKSCKASKKMESSSQLSFICCTTSKMKERQKNSSFKYLRIRKKAAIGLLSLFALHDSRSFYPLSRVLRPAGDAHTTEDGYLCGKSSFIKRHLLKRCLAMMLEFRFHCALTSLISPDMGCHQIERHFWPSIWRGCSFYQESLSVWCS